MLSAKKKEEDGRRRKGKKGGERDRVVFIAFDSGFFKGNPNSPSISCAIS